jgi:hypothetical protein
MPLSGGDLGSRLDAELETLLMALILAVSSLASDSEGHPMFWTGLLR